jgi:hypothetical protein
MTGLNIVLEAAELLLLTVFFTIPLSLLINLASMVTSHFSQEILEKISLLYVSIDRVNLGPVEDPEEYLETLKYFRKLCYRFAILQVNLVLSLFEWTPIN